MHFFAVLYISNGQKYIITLRGGVIFFAFQLYRLVVFDIFIAFLFMVGSGAGL